MKAKRVLFITQEIAPYVAESEYTVLGREFPPKAQEAGREIRTFMPKWGDINERRNQLHEVIRLSGMNLIIDETDHPLIIKVASIQAARMQVYFIDNDEYFNRKLHAVDAKGKEYKNNVERAVFYARGVLETVKKLRWVPDVIHCQGWMSAVIPLYIKKAYADEPSFRDCRVVYSHVFNELQNEIQADKIHGVLAFKDVDGTEIDGLSEKMTANDLCRLAIKYADGVTFNAAHHDPELIEFANQCGVKNIETDNHEFGNIIDFFDEVWSEGKTEIPEEEEE